jgi:hypothetical protein
MLYLRLVIHLKNVKRIKKLRSVLHSSVLVVNTDEYSCNGLHICYRHVICYMLLCMTTGNLSSTAPGHNG